MKTEEEKDKKVRELTDEELMQTVGRSACSSMKSEQECKAMGCKWVRNRGANFHEYGWTCE